MLSVSSYLSNIVTLQKGLVKQQQTPVGRDGQLRLRFECHNNKTVMVESYFRTPLQVMQAIPDKVGCLAAYLLSPTGGVVQHDSYDIKITLEANTHALVTTVAATKVYRMPQGKAVQHITIDVGENAILEFVPDALILFKDADFEQIVTIKLQKGALCMFQDSVMGGRVAHHDEFLQFRQLRNRLDIRDEEGLIAYDAMQFAPTRHDHNRLGLLDGYTCWGSAYIVGDISRFQYDNSTFCEMVNDSDSGNVHSSISELHRSGFAYRILANRLESLEQAFEKLRSNFRHALNIPYSSLRK